MPRRTDRKKHKYLGEATHGAGNRKNRRGKGSKGGRGRAGFHKHRRFQMLKLEKVEGPTTPKGFVPVAKAARETVTLRNIAHGIAVGKWPRQGEAYEIPLGRGVKVIGAGKLGFRANVTASAFSAGAKKSIEAAGGAAKTIA